MRSLVVFAFAFAFGCGPSTEDIRAALGAAQDTDVKGVRKQGDGYVVTAECTGAHAHRARIEIVLDGSGDNAVRSGPIILRTACLKKEIEGLDMEQEAMRRAAEMQAERNKAKR
jgi:hypothetical protein